MASHITGISTVSSADCSNEQTWKHQRSAMTTDSLIGDVTGSGEISSQRASNAENVSLSWRHHSLRQPLGPSHRQATTSIILTSCQLDDQEQSSEKFELKYQSCLSMIRILKYHLPNCCHFVQAPMCWSRDHQSCQTPLSCCCHAAVMMFSVLLQLFPGMLH